jgi:N-acetylmuramoyl-L-alanine amidase CwlA
VNPCKSKEEYLFQIIEPARRVCKRYGYLPSVLIAQACLENGYGMAPDCHVLVRANNMIGQKSELLNKSWTDIGLSVWPGRSIAKNTPEQYGNQIVRIVDNFRVFDSVEQSLADFLLFLTYASNYGPGGTPKYGGEVLAIKDPETLIRAVGGRGYATGQTYPTSVMRIVREHNLTQYDDITTVAPTDQIPPALQKGKKQDTDKLIINQNPKGIRTHNTSKRTGPIEYICIHYVGALGDAKQNIDYYNQPSVTDASADFYCGHTGDIWQYNVRPMERYCWSVGGGRQSQYGGTYYGICKNANSISIEMCVKSKSGKAPAYPNDPNWYITDATLQACIRLTKYLMKLYAIDVNHVIRHFDVNGKYCPGVVGWNGPSGSDAAWQSFKASLSGVAPEPTPTPTGKKYRVRVGIYKYKSYLEKLRANIKEKTGLDCFTEDHSDGTHIFCGSFSSKENAEARAQLLKSYNFDTKIVKV